MRVRACAGARVAARRYGGIKALDGSIWGMPFNAPSVLKIVPTTGAVTEVGALPSGGWKWHGGARCGEYLVGIPSHAMSVLLVHTPTDTITLVEHGIPGGYKWGGGVADGHAAGSAVWAVPSDAPALLQIVPSEQRVRVVPGLTAQRNKWQGGVLARDGHVYCIPCDAPSVLRIDPASGAYSMHGDLGACANKFQGAYVHHDGVIWALPESCEQVLRIVPPEAPTAPTAPTMAAARQPPKPAPTADGAWLPALLASWSCCATR